jgi:hypothetical protein
MKATTPVLLLSLAANLALAGLLLWRAAPAAPAPAPDGAVLNPAPASAAPAAPTGLVGPGPQTWQRLAAANDAEFVAGLRAEGFPPGMMLVLVNQRLLARHADALGKFRAPADYDYWRKNAYEDALSPEDRAARRALSRQIADERRQLLGDDADLATQYERANRERLYGDLPVEKVDQLTAINRDYSEITALLRDRARGMILPEDREQFARLEQEKRADLARLLTPEELREYDLRSSPSAAAVRQQLRNFDVTEDEYRALVGLQLAFDATYGNRNNLGGEQEQRRTAAAAELTAQIRALMPPERFAEYEIKTDPTYSRVASLISQFNSPADPGAVVSAQRDLAERFNALRQGRTLAPAVRDAQLDVLSVEANRRMAAALGPEAFKIYKGTGGPINALLNRPAGGGP